MWAIYGCIMFLIVAMNLTDLGNAVPARALATLYVNNRDILEQIVVFLAVMIIFVYQINLNTNDPNLSNEFLDLGIIKYMSIF